MRRTIKKIPNPPHKKGEFSFSRSHLSKFILISPFDDYQIDHKSIKSRAEKFYWRIKVCECKKINCLKFVFYKR